MNLKGLVLGTTVAVTLGVPAAIATAYAADGIYVPLLSYRTGPYAGSGTPIANGMSDYLNMLNERDGGIGGVKIIVEECETGYDTKKGIECYESIKGKGPVVVNPYSTGITLQLIPKAAVDKIPILSMGYGLSPSADGNQFPWIFNPPATYWDGASVFVKHAAEVEGGFDKLKGKKLGLVYLDADAAGLALELGLDLDAPSFSELLELVRWNEPAPEHHDHCGRLARSLANELSGRSRPPEKQLMGEARAWLGVSVVCHGKTGPAAIIASLLRTSRA